MTEAQKTLIHRCAIDLCIDGPCDFSEAFQLIYDELGDERPRSADILSEIDHAYRVEATRRMRAMAAQQSEASVS